MAGPSTAAQDELVLYYLPDSFYSQRGLLALKEKGLKFTTRLIDLRKNESYEPWYLKINKMGQVPVLQHGDTFVPDSAKIITYLDQKFGAPLLQPDVSTDYGRSVAEYTSLLGSIDIPVITMGTMRFPELTVDSKVPEPMRRIFQDEQEKMLDYLEAKRKENPDMAEVYTEKIEEKKQFLAKITDVNKVKEAISVLGEVLPKVEQRLAQTESAFPGKSTWLCGEDFTAADVCLAVTLTRLIGIGLSKQFIADGKSPRAEAYFKRLQGRQSVKEVCLMRMGAK